MSGAPQMCPKCGSPLSPCRCKRDEEYLVDPGEVWNSTLGVRKGKGLSRGSGLKSRGVTKVYEDDPLRYGPLFRELRTWPCFATEFLVTSPCRPGYAPPSAHHEDRKGHLDVEGLIPACGRHHDMLHEDRRALEEKLRERGNWTIKLIGRVYVVRAADRLRDRGELPSEVEAAISSTHTPRGTEVTS